MAAVRVVSLVALYVSCALCGATARITPDNPGAWDGFANAHLAPCVDRAAVLVDGRLRFVGITMTR